MGRAGLRGLAYEPATFQIRQRLLAVDTNQPRDRLAAPGDDDCLAALDPLEVLAETVVQLADTHLGFARM